MRRTFCLVLGLMTPMSMAPAALAGQADDMINQLLPAPATPTSAPSGGDQGVFSVQAATKGEMIQRLGASAARSLGQPENAPPLSLASGHEAELLAATQNLPSMQIAVAFQGGSDALSPDSVALLGTLGDALSDEKLRPYKFVVGVHTKSVGSDAYNFSLSALRAKAIVDILVAVHGVPRERLFPVGFGKLVGSADTSGVPDERIQIVNLGDTPIRQTPDQPAPTPPVATVLVPNVVMPVARPSHVAHRRRPVTSQVATAPVEPARHRRLQHGPAASVATTTPRIRHHEIARGEPDLAAGRSQPHRRRRFDNDAQPTDTADRGGFFGDVGLGGSAGMIERSSSNGGNGGASSGGGGSSGGGSSGGGAGGGSSGGAGGGSSKGGGWSDRRLKRRITWRGTSARGYNLYSFQYVWGGPLVVGVMAQEILRQCPEAVIATPSGYFQVDYSKLDVEMVTLDEWLSTKAMMLAL